MVILRKGWVVFHGGVSELGGSMRIVAKRGHETRITDVSVNEVPGIVDKLRFEGFNVLEVRNSIIDELLGGGDD